VHPFRFGVVAAQSASGDAWVDRARRLESMGYDSLLVPDGLRQVLEPFAALAALASATRSLRLGTYVLATDLHNPVRIAKQSATLDFLSGGRFELGLGAGRPDAAADADLLGLPFVSAGERVERLAGALSHIKSLLSNGQVGPGPLQRPPRIMVAGSGRKMLSIAGEQADIVALGLQPTATEDQALERVGWLREAAGGRFEQLELNINLMAVGDRVPRYVEMRMGLTAGRLGEMGSVAAAVGSVDQMCQTLERRRDRVGLSYIAVSDEMAETLAPVVERLAGR
jgi:probable F420-dependent oxidoreductase